MVKLIDFRQLSKAALEEILGAAGITDNDREWLRSRGLPVGLLEITDKYKVSRLQQKKAHVLLHAICEWSGYTPLETEKIITKQMFMDSQLPQINYEFSLADCSMEIARKYITWLIDFCLMNNIPCGEPLWKLCEDIPRYVYMSAVHKHCAVCGKKAECHHEPPIGMGVDRKSINHLGLTMLPLCRKHHNEIHRIGANVFMKKYMLEPVKIDGVILKVYKLNGW